MSNEQTDTDTKGQFTNAKTAITMVCSVTYDSLAKAETRKQFYKAINKCTIGVKSKAGALNKSKTPDAAVLLTTITDLVASSIMDAYFHAQFDAAENESFLTLRNRVLENLNANFKQVLSELSEQAEKAGLA